MKPVTKEEPPAKKVRLAIKMPEVLANRDKMPLHVMKGVFGDIPRQEHQRLRIVCRFWSRCVATRPPHFRQLFKLNRFVCDWYVPGEAPYTEPERWWLDVERSLKCCGHLKDLASKLVGELFLSTVAADLEIALRVHTKGGNWTYCHFPNKLTKETALSVLHFCSHLREVALTVVWNIDGSFFSSVRRDVVQLLCPMHCRRLSIDLENSELNIPSLKSLTDAIKHQEISFCLSWEGTDSSTARVKEVLEQFAIDTRHLYSRLGIHLSAGEVEQHHWTVLLKMVIEFFSSALKESRKIVPRVNFHLRGEAPGWPFLPFSEMEPTHVQEESMEGEDEDEDGEPVTGVYRTYEYKFGGGPSAQAFRAEVTCWQNEDEGNEYVYYITFLLD